MERFHGIGLRTVSFNTFFQFLVRVIGSGTNLIATLIIASFLGYETIGSFIKVVEYVAIFYLLVDFGLNPVFQKLYVKRVDSSLGNLVILRLLIVGVLVPIISFSTLLIPQKGIVGGGYSTMEKYAIAIYALSLFSSALNMSWQALLQQKLANKLTVPTAFIASTVFLVTIFFAAKQANFFLLFVAFLFSSTVYTIFTYLLIRKRFSIRLTANKVGIFSKRMLLASWPLGLVLFINLLYVKVDIILLSLFKQNVEVGIYGISYRFFDVAVAIPAFLANSTYPLLLGIMENRKSYLLLFKKYLVFYALASIIITLLAVGFSPIIILFRREFTLSVLPLQILLFSLPFFFLTSLLQWHFLIRGKVKMLIPLYSGVLLLNIILNILFVPIYSYIASAVITGFCEAIVFIVLMCYFLKDEKD